MISRSEAIAIALNTDNARKLLPKGTPIEVELADKTYTVTFGVIVTHPMPGPDFLSKIKIDARTGRVTAKIIGN
ncbi:PepSY domain-containing protein [Singulisphaera acidiphila]|uniref:Peptidase propeptide domain-containing protein n=1 Tax=Singulisphaera acidiphila (strain ATCC BAA-1392 / DSM 18658 / VKM B-2454 / MOB10) TaxID=886293 RepID=L0DGP2_SINAD|nr:PepSY domain-containing protein [Singulisphaera acidiphila]AGA28427.1 Peptidase propeptide domain-containing protein [Singulisphaera acidiphila DSM 18658]